VTIRVSSVGFGLYAFCSAQNTQSFLLTIIVGLRAILLFSWGNKTKEAVLLLSLGLGLYAFFIMQNACDPKPKFVLFGTVSILQVFSSRVDLQDCKDEFY
jgi:hypothetical protein